MLGLFSALMLAPIASQAAVVNVVTGFGDVYSATPALHSGAILDTATNFLWLDATETVGRSVADVSAKLGPGGEFAGFQIATEAQINTLFVNAGLTLTQNVAPGSVAEIAAVASFIAIYGDTAPASCIACQAPADFDGVSLWYADPFNTPGAVSQVAAFNPIDDKEERQPRRRALISRHRRTDRPHWVGQAPSIRHTRDARTCGGMGMRGAWAFLQ
jgi:hypothetical protein